MLHLFYTGGDKNMSIIGFLSYCVLWILTLILSSMVIYLYKRIEKSSKKNKTLAESNAGLPKGEVYPIKKIYDTENKEVNMGQSTILLFTSAHCDVCKRVYPMLEIAKQKYSNINIIIMMLATNEEAKNTINRFNIKHNTPVSLIKDEELFALGIPGFPFCYLLDPNGNIIEKGIVNTMEHFDILLSNYVHIRNVS